MNEKHFQARIVHLAHLTGWHCVHYRPAGQGGKWRTPLTGDTGCPDLILARSGVVILAELKTEHGQLTPQQRLWNAALGDHGRVWRPADWDGIAAELSGRRP